MAVTAREKSWHGDELKRKLERKLAARLVAAAMVLLTALRNAVNTPYPPASRPGEPPHRRSGRLQAGIVVDADTENLQINMGFKPEVERQAMSLEFGTRNMRPRPFVRRTLMRMQNTLLRMLKP